MISCPKSQVRLKFQGARQQPQVVELDSNRNLYGVSIKMHWKFLVLMAAIPPKYDTFTTKGIEK